MFRIETDSQARNTVLRLSGWMRSQHIPELKEQIEGSGRKITLDLGKLTLVDREAVRFLGACEAKGMELRNCPSYIELWLASEKNWDPSA
jgi:anti-anti-sigma regulatory factor